MQSHRHIGIEDLPHQPNSPPAKAGVLLVNLGTPDAPTIKAVRTFLAQFLSDPRVIEYPRWLWRLVLHGIILRIRPPRSTRAYARIWSAQGSPLRIGSQALAETLQDILTAQTPGPVKVALAMRYGAPDVAQQICALQRAGVRRLLVLPLYPQYSSSATGAVLDAVADAIKILRWPPEIRLINDYYDDAHYLQALANSIDCWWQQHGRGDKLLLSFHGIPERYRDAGDPYFCQCHSTARQLCERLGLTTEDIVISFQSRLGRGRWLRPYTSDVVRQLATEGVQKLDVACPGFAVDCLETLEEIAIQNKEFFQHAGGQMLRYIPALGATREHATSLAGIVLRHGQGWPEFTSGYDPSMMRSRSSQANRRREIIASCETGSA